MQNNSTLKNTKPGHAILNANNNNGRNAVNSQFQLKTYGKWEECVLSNAIYKKFLKPHSRQKINDHGGGSR